MQIIAYDGTPEELERIQAEKEAEGFLLVEVQNVVEGNFLGFVDKEGYNPPAPTPPKTPIEEELAVTKAKVETLEAADLDNKEMINGLGEMLMALMEG